MLLIFGIAAAGALAVAGYAWLAQRDAGRAARAVRGVRQFVSVIAVLAGAIDGVLDALQRTPPQPQSRPTRVPLRWEDLDEDGEPYELDQL